MLILILFFGCFLCVSVKTLCILYNETADTLANHWYSFVNKKRKSVSVPSLILLEQLENDVLKKNYAAKISVPEASKKKERIIDVPINHDSPKKTEIVSMTYQSVLVIKTVLYSHTLI